MVGRTKTDRYYNEQTEGNFYFMLSSEINTYQKQIKVISVTSEMI